MKLLLVLVVVLLSSVVSVRAGSMCPPSEAPVSNDTNIVNNIIIDSRGFEVAIRFLSVDGDNLDWDGFCLDPVTACHPGPQDNWLYSSIIPRPANVDTLYALVDATFNCTDSDCVDALQLYLGEFSANNTDITDFSNYRQIAFTNNVEMTFSTSSDFINILLRDNGTCVSLNKFQVYSKSCNTLYSSDPAVPFGNTGNITCVANTVAGDASSVQVSCLNTGMFESPYPCDCLAGYSGSDGTNCIECSAGMYKSLVGSSDCITCPLFSEAISAASSECVCEKGGMRLDPANISTPCDQCEAGYYWGGMCLQCPRNSSSIGGTEASCTCEPGLVTPGDESTTTTDVCSECSAEYFRNGDSCEPCPMFSSRPFSADETQCMCDGNRLTNTGQPMTTEPACDNCPLNHFPDVSGCTPCPMGSIRSAYSQSTCTCTNSRLTVDGQNETTISGCLGCISAYYRVGDSCIGCPLNSMTVGATTTTTCTCNAGYSMQSGAMETTSDPCLVIVGFTSQSQTVDEGDIPNMIQASVMASVVTSVNIPLVTTPIDPAHLNVPGNLMFLNTDQAQLSIEVIGNELAFNDYSPVMVTIQESTTHVVGGTINSMPVYGSMSVTVIEDDKVSVGFALPRAMFNETQREGELALERIGGISTDLTIRVSLTDSGIINFTNPIVTFDVGGPSVEALRFTIIDDNSGFMEIRSTEVQLSVVSPSQLNSSSVEFGGNGLSETFTVQIINDDDTPTSAPIPLTTIIGIAVGGAAFAILLFIIFVLVLCICRLHSINLRGFYATYEDQSKEPPTMLRYSASLRSISSQTVVPVENTQGSIIKENEFYV